VILDNDDGPDEAGARGQAEGASGEVDTGRDNRWANSIAELEKELRLALEEQQVESLSAGTPTSLSPHSVEALSDETQSRERTETTGSRPEEL
jgi:hypothetical protein